MKSKNWGSILCPFCPTVFAKSEDYFNHACPNGPNAPGNPPNKREKAFRQAHMNSSFDKDGNLIMRGEDLAKMAGAEGICDCGAMYPLWEWAKRASKCPKCKARPSQEDISGQRHDTTPPDWRPKGEPVDEIAERIIRLASSLVPPEKPKMRGPYLPHKAKCSQKTQPRKMGVGYFCEECGVRLGFVPKEQANAEIKRDIGNMISIESMDQILDKLPDFLRVEAERKLRLDSGVTKSKIESMHLEGPMMQPTSAIVICNCGQKNKVRIPGKDPKCAKCKNVL